MHDQISANAQGAVLGLPKGSNGTAPRTDGTEQQASLDSRRIVPSDHFVDAFTDRADIIGQLRMLGWERRHWQRAALRLNNATKAIARDVARARMVQAGQSVPDRLPTTACTAEDWGHVRLQYVPMLDALAVFEAHAKECERQMTKLVKKLPIWEWVASVRGFGAINFAKVLAETGDLSKYDRACKVWKRMGLHVVDGRAARRVRGDGGIEQEYSVRRRTVMHLIGESLVKLNDGKYRAYYDARRAKEDAERPDLSKGHRHLRAMRYIEQKALRDLWRAWRGA